MRSPVSWWYEVETAVNPMIFNLTTSNTRLFIQVLFILTVDKVNDGLPAKEERGRERGRERGKEGEGEGGM